MLNNLKTYGFRAFSVIAPILWNHLPVDMRSIDDVNILKSKLKTFLFKRVYELSIFRFFILYFCDYVYYICNDFSIFIFHSDLFEAM